MPAFSSFMLAASVATGLAGTAASIIQGNHAAGQQDQALAAQQTGAARAKADAKETRTQNQMEINKANQKKPDVRAILADKRKTGNVKLPDSTLLTGTTGIDPNALNLGSMAALGQ